MVAFAAFAVLLSSVVRVRFTNRMRWSGPLDDQPYAGISLDLSRMDKILQINGKSQSGSFRGAGIEEPQGGRSYVVLVVEMRPVSGGGAAS